MKSLLDLFHPIIDPMLDPRDEAFRDAGALHDLFHEDTSQVAVAAGVVLVEDYGAIKTGGALEESVVGEQTHEDVGVYQPGRLGTRLAAEQFMTEYHIPEGLEQCIEPRDDEDLFGERGYDRFMVCRVLEGATFCSVGFYENHVEIIAEGFYLFDR